MDKEEVGVGTKKESLQAKSVIVESTLIEMQKDKEQRAIGEKVTLVCQYPDRAKPLEISKVQYLKDKKIVIHGLWYKVDENGMIPYSSALAHLLRYEGCKNLKDLKGKKVETTTDENGFLIAKAY
jgi:hypothetical protein